MPVVIFQLLVYDIYSLLNTMSFFNTNTLPLLARHVPDNTIYSPRVLYNNMHPATIPVTNDTFVPFTTSPTSAFNPLGNIIIIDHREHLGNRGRIIMSPSTSLAANEAIMAGNVYLITINDTAITREVISQ